MKLTIKTSLLKNLLDKTDKCASNNKMLPITGMMCINVSDNKLTLTTTDGSNYLYVWDTVESSDFYAVVDESSFVKLVSKTTSDTMTFELVDSALKVYGNGTYSLELPVDENGNLIKFPNPLHNVSYQPQFKWSKEALELILKTNKATLSTSLAEPCYTGYYVSNCVITSDRSVICHNDLNLLSNPVLVNPEIMNILSVFNSDVDVCLMSNDIIFKGTDCLAYGHLMNDIDEYNAEAVINLVNTELPHKCEVNRNSLLNALDRLSLFVSPYDKNAITLKFTNEYLEIRSAKLNAVERIKYAYINDVSDSTCDIDIEMFKKQINVQSGDVVELWYGNDVFIKMVDGDTTQLIPLLVE